MQKLTVEIIKMMFKERHKNLHKLMLISEAKGDANSLADMTLDLEKLKVAEEDFCKEFNVEISETA